MKIIRMMAWMFRFKNNIQNSNHKQQGQLSVTEIDKAEIFVLKIIQKESFLESDRRTCRLNPFYDKNGLLRTTTTTHQRNDSNSFRFRVTLSAKREVVNYLIKYTHENLCHVGTQELLNALRERFWILGGHRTVRKCIIMPKKLAPTEI